MNNPSDLFFPLRSVSVRLIYKVRIAGGNGFCNGYNADGSLFTGFSVTWGLPTGSSHKPTLKTLPLAFSRWSKSSWSPVCVLSVVSARFLFVDSSYFLFFVPHRLILRVILIRSVINHHLNTILFFFSSSLGFFFCVCRIDFVFSIISPFIQYFVYLLELALV